jgi:hypothetical protein
MDRRQPGVASAGCVAPVTLNVLKKSQDHRYIELFDFDLKGLHVQPGRGEANKKFEAVGVCIGGMRTGLSFAWQMIEQEGTQVRCEGCHGTSPRCSASPAFAICSMRAGVACKYQ